MTFRNPKDLAMTVKTTALIRNIATRKDAILPRLKPHTWVAMYEQDQPDPLALGIVFHVWSPEMTHLRFALTLKGDKLYETATFHEFSSQDWDVKGQRFIVVPKRWCWTRLLREYRGLSAANL